MAIKLKPKFFGPLTMQSESEGSFSYTTDAGYSTLAGAPASGELASPSDLTMAALASCICLSLEMEGKKLKIDHGKISLVIKAAKALDLPNRFGSFDVIVTLGKKVEQELAGKLLKNAKEICTVSNTLNADINITLQQLE